MKTNSRAVSYGTILQEGVQEQVAAARKSSCHRVSGDALLHSLVKDYVVVV